jgi:hypothetical protein
MKVLLEILHFGRSILSFQTKPAFFLLKISASAFLLFTGIKNISHAQINLNEGLVANYGFNGNYSDAGPNGIELVASRPVTFISNRYSNPGMAAGFNSFAHLQCQIGNSFFNVQEITLSAWIKPNNSINDQKIVGKNGIGVGDI